MGRPGDSGKEVDPDMPTAIMPSVCDPQSDDSLDALTGLAQHSSRFTEQAARHLIDKIDRLARAGTWPRRLPGEPKTWDRFCREVIGYEPAWFDEVRQGLAILDAKGNRNPTVQEAVAAARAVAERANETKPINGHGGDRKSDDRDQGSHRTLKRGDNADYYTARIARDRPDILERMKRGEFQSVHAAAVEAGIVKRQVKVTDDLDGWARAVDRNFPGKKLDDLVARIVQNRLNRDS